MTARNLPFIRKGHTGNVSFTSRTIQYPRFVFLGYVVGIVGVFAVIIVTLFSLTVVRGSYYTVLAEDNRIREIVIDPPRGALRDRKGVVLARSEPPVWDPQKERMTSARIYEKRQAVSHVMGYRQIADTSDLERDACRNRLKVGDKIGKKGVEALFECELRGEHGKELIEVDAWGKKVRTLNILPPISGTDIQLALDSALQEKAHELMRGKHGAVVAMIPSTGEVLVLESSPGFDPQAFEDADAAITRAYLDDPEKPLFNRSLEGHYPPASTFKMFVATAGLEEGVITPEETIRDDGFIEAGPRKFHNWFFLEYGRTDGEVDMVKSLQRSNDIYYYILGGRLGPEKIKRWAEHFGFQNKSGIGLQELAGIIPTSFWKEQVLGERWFLGDTYNLSIGQGYVTATPLQVTAATAAFANGGYLCTPHLLKQDGTEQESACKKIPISEKTYDVIREGMYAACEPGGTGHPFFDFRAGKKMTESVTESPPESSSSAVLADATAERIHVGCKTGTAESHAASGRPHAWFTVFAPFDQPEIVLTVLVEEGGQGSDVAGPIAKEILAAYFERME